MGVVNPCHIVLYMASQATMINIKEIIKSLFRIIYIILLLYVIYQVLKVIFGGSWSTENIIIAGMGIILAGMFVIVGFLINQGKDLGKLDERTRNVAESLTRLGNDFKQHLTKHK